ARRTSSPSPSPAPASSASISISTPAATRSSVPRSPSPRSTSNIACRVPTAFSGRRARSRTNSCPPEARVASTASPEELIAAGQPADALKRLQERVREKPQDAKLRTFLFQLLCVLGQWDRAQAQLELCGQLDHGTL